jgi:hypothetical protein
MGSVYMKQCSECGCEIQVSAEYCIHCGRPRLFPNVDMAEQQEERKALQERYEVAVQAAKVRGCESVAKAFEQAVSTAKAVIARPAYELARIAQRDSEIYATFYNLCDSGVRQPSDDEWTRMRRAAEGTVFPNCFKEVRYACLTLSGKGLPHYGECFMVPREEFIAHRATVFEETASFSCRSAA